MGDPAGGPLRQNQLAGMNQVACDSMLGSIHDANLEADESVTIVDMLYAFTHTEFSFGKATDRQRANS